MSSFYLKKACKNKTLAINRTIKQRTEVFINLLIYA